MKSKIVVVICLVFVLFSTTACTNSPPTYYPGGAIYCPLKVDNESHEESIIILEALIRLAQEENKWRAYELEERLAVIKSNRDFELLRLYLNYLISTDDEIKRLMNEEEAAAYESSTQIMAEVTAMVREDLIKRLEETVNTPAATPLPVYCQFKNGD